MSFDNTQLTSAFGYDVNNMRFKKPIKGSIPNSTVEFLRLPIGTKNPDGSYGDLIIPTVADLYSFGLSPSENMTTGKIDGYTLSLCLHNREGATDEEKQWVDTFNKIVDHIRKYLIDHRDEIEKYELEAAELKKLNPLYYKKEKGKIVEGTGPVLYPKVLQNKKNQSITSVFCDQDGNDIDPMSLLNKRCRVTAAVKIESVFVGSKISLQVKVSEAQVKLIDNVPKRLLCKPESNQKVVFESSLSSSSTEAAKPSFSGANDEDEDDDGSIKGDDDSKDEEDDKPTPPPAPVVPVKEAAKPAARRPAGRKA